MKTFVRILLGLLGISLIVMPNIDPAGLLANYGNVSYILTFLGIMILMLAPAYPDNAQFLKTYAPARANNLLTMSFFFVAVIAVSMVVNFASLYYQIYMGNDAGITFFVRSFAYGLVAGGAISAIGITALIYSQIRPLAISDL